MSITDQVDRAFDRSLGLLEAVIRLTAQLPQRHEDIGVRLLRMATRLPASLSKAQAVDGVYLKRHYMTCAKRHVVECAALLDALYCLGLVDEKPLGIAQCSMRRLRAALHHKHPLRSLELELPYRGVWRRSA